MFCMFRRAMIETLNNVSMYCSLPVQTPRQLHVHLFFGCLQSTFVSLHNFFSFSSTPTIPIHVYELQSHFPVCLKSTFRWNWTLSGNYCSRQQPILCINFVFPGLGCFLFEPETLVSLDCSCALFERCSKLFVQRFARRFVCQRLTAVGRKFLTTRGL